MKFVQHLELELLEEEEYDHQPSAVDRQALARPAAAAPSEPAAQLCEPLQPGDRSSRTRDWVEQSSQYGQLCLHYDADISAATNVTAVISKLPAALALKWGEHSVHNGLVRPTLPDLDSWLRGYVAAGLEVLLGADVIELIVAREVIDGPPGALCAVRTLLGWTVTGRAPDQNLPVNKDVHHIRVNPADVQLDELALVTKDILPRGHWLLERVVTVFPGVDSRVQVVKVATATGRKFGIGGRSLVSAVSSATVTDSKWTQSGNVRV
ncbi:hypothetical protein FJT64_004317 [Amphibalanus amphitrite]|uniref:DUF5641 domain-containing protein n=1 Tax=Amphibalanus amphitrite TaxID=1232801 RepID=A0A6A4VZG9_AMPAM|nr:hypothetical protein FJT64_004317 [Amphibalanus amphitrite]